MYYVVGDSKSNITKQINNGHSKEIKGVLLFQDFHLKGKVLYITYWTRQRLEFTPLNSAKKMKLLALKNYKTNHLKEGRGWVKWEAPIWWMHRPDYYWTSTSYWSKREVSMGGVRRSKSRNEPLSQGNSQLPLRPCHFILGPFMSNLRTMVPSET